MKGSVLDTNPGSYLAIRQSSKACHILTSAANMTLRHRD